MNDKANAVRLSEIFDSDGNSFHLTDDQILEFGGIPPEYRSPESFKARRVVRSKVLKAIKEGKREWWTRSELRQILELRAQ
ncbi:MAG: hypothetical protein EAZ73_09280 [Oscillatoriales cyanobacterium]|uniref:hypothetical protein n=1 Tax=unclassified Microcoleus TaxID=2642155 RepID=UPI001DA771E5|nr:MULTISPECIES: hypothetical protein [unclassified Microcoleus]TAF00834.1 MAG: hypothetical protein EAZ79_01315 [Oscillatoriales cyanobacterium]MCC3459829.1 hypothetical protein [Microcoleus sp. PH2017_11_PCY_U_A]MCC3478262.1 hypothetical protein [Microcoleus sp. PH2017_12_PCY_D_A]TAF21407.1 MAG: hypothetical protein EAZ73_09280 [Oscillatoriales cyanobacterium]TAF39666.1 MAG: hypothetical protein EAZ69_00065 [Oscillatoriales cyanobacterium]